VSRRADRRRALAFLVLAACSRAPDGREAADSGPSFAAPAVGAGPADANAPAPAAADASAAIEAEVGAFDFEPFLRGEPRAAKAIGHTSVVLKVDLDTGQRAVWKPASRRGPLRYKGEIAAYRLGLALGLPNVPPAAFRAYAASTLATAAKDDRTRELVAAEALAHGGVVKGSLVPWIDGLDFLPLEKEPWASKWRAWLSAEGVIESEADRDLARQISALCVFDFVTGNWDRWSGGNVGVDRTGTKLLFVDNDGAFFETPPKDGLARNEALLRAIHKLPRGLVTRLRALGDEALAAALGEETKGVPLLSAKALAGVAERRRSALAIIDARIAAAGEARVLAFP